jgi:uncharacterized protein
VKIIAVVLLSATLFALPALALDLQSARAAGVVVERSDGYISSRRVRADLQTLVVEENAKRKKEYAAIAEKSGQSPEAVGKLAAIEIVKNLPAGSLYEGTDGNVKTK